MDSEAMVIKHTVAFTNLEIGCKYISRSGDIWEVVGKRPSRKSAFPYLAKKFGSSKKYSFTDKGQFCSESCRTQNDLLVKISEIGVEHNCVE